MKFFATLLFTLICVPAFAQRPASTDNSLLWCISGNGLTQPSFLFGTEHMICSNDYVWKSYMQDCFSRCKKLCTELDFTDPSLLTQLHNNSVMKTGKELRSYYRSDDYQAVHLYFLDSLHMDLDTMQHYQPFVLQALVSMKVAHCDSIVSYEFRLAQQAISAGMKMTGLETVKDQVDVLDSTAPESVTKYLLLAAVAGEAAYYEYSKLQASYTAEDVKTLYRMAASASLLDSRNKKWIPKIKKMIRSNSVFFAVGAAHLWGEQGVIALLRKEGYTVIPIKKGLDTYPWHTERLTVNGKTITTINIVENKFFNDGRNFTDYSKKSDSHTFELIDKLSELAGYDVAAYIQSHLELSEWRTPGMDDMVTVAFGLDYDGKINNVRLKQGIGADYDAEVLRMIKNMPHWKKGTQVSGVIMPVVLRKRDEGE